MTQRYNPYNTQKAIFTINNGFEFGNGILLVMSDTTLNEHNKGISRPGRQYHYEMEGFVSPLTNQ